MRLPRWARITGKDKRKQYPEQQGVSLGRAGDYTIIFPYGHYGDLPANALLRELAPGVAMPVTVERPSDTAQGEPVFFHPGTNTRIILKNSGDLKIVAAGRSLDIECNTANVKADQVNLGEGGAPIARQGDPVQVTVTGGSSAGTYSGTITAGGANTLI